MADNKKYLDKEGLEHLSEYIKNRLEIVDEMPESPAGDAIVFYVGEDTEDYKKGNIYQYNEIDTKWKPLASGEGTSVILNGVDKTAEVASFYAPERYGVEGRIPVAHGENEPPTWEAFSGYGPSIVEDSLIFSYGLMPKVEGTSIIFDLDS